MNSDVRCFSCSETGVYCKNDFCAQVQNGRIVEVTVNTSFILPINNDSCFVYHLGDPNFKETVLLMMTRFLLQGKLTSYQEFINSLCSDELDTYCIPSYLPKQV